MKKYSIDIDVIRISLPAVLTIGLFLFAIFGVALPSFKSYMVSHKKEMIAAEIDRVIAELNDLEKRVEEGVMTLSEAQKSALNFLGQLRYGKEKKDYFWVNNLLPKMLMHPYLPELVGKDLRGYRDSNGKEIFVDLVEMVAVGGKGYMEYLWQWKDDPQRVLPKISYVKHFKPWEWIIGTGVYVEDIEEEISMLTEKLLRVVTMILGVVLALAVFIVGNGFRERRKRLQAEEKLLRYQECLEEQVAQRTSELKKAMAEVKVLSGLLPICSSCKKIRNEEGGWNSIEAYIHKHSEAKFSHGICPECLKKLYPDFADRVTMALNASK